MTEKLDLDHLRQWIGRSSEASDIVTTQLVKGLRATLFQEIGEPKAGDAAPFTVHPHLRRIEVDTPKGVVTYSAPGAIFVGQERHYGAVPALGLDQEIIGFAMRVRPAVAIAGDGTADQPWIVLA